ncbi:MAG: type VI secretion system tip protein VgrG [Deltaproteobacteria bacterium]|nr:type VI secretion system tip protein VgrG [Deltaproteobacteria bacterium]
MPEFTQDNQYISVSTPLGKDKLLLRGFHGEEQISGLFHFTLEMVSEDNALDASQVVGESATITINLADESQRYLNGIVTRFIQAGSNARFTTYYAELRPWLWLLTMTSDSQIFQNQSVPEIIEAVFSNLGFTDYRNALSATYSPREYCVQYQESAFDFVSRLMEDEGIFYFFEHEDGKHTLVLADDADAHAACSGMESALYKPWAPDWPEADFITHCTLEQQVTTGKYAMDDFNFETPDTDLIASVDGTSSNKMRIYEYPGGFDKKDAGEKKAKVRIEGYEMPEKLLKGNSHCRAFIAGYKFDLKEHDRDDINATYVLRWVSHSATLETYANSFEAFPVDVPFRPPRTAPKPVIAGSQTAIVVGKSGEEIWTDKYGRIKVQFHWDQKGQKDENSSCWIRVAQGWGGKQWGGLFLPRIGQEVIVSFLEGNPDLPLITGAVYNAQQTVPYTLPSEATKSTIKSNSSKGGGGFNEIRFEDKKDAEEFYIHAQKDMVKEVLNDETNTIKMNRTTTIQEGDETLTVEKGKRTVTIQEGDETLVVEKGNRIVQVNTGDETHEVKGKRDLTITGNETHTNKADFTQEVTGNFSLKVNGNLTIDVKGSVTIKAGQSLTNKAGTSLTNEAGTSLENKAGTSLTNKANASLTNEAGASLTNKGNASQTVESGGILIVKGSMVKIN